MSYSVEQMCKDFESLVRLERQSDYSKPELDDLYEAAISIRTKLDTADFASSVPYELYRSLGNIDLGAIKREYRDWILEDVDKAIADIRLNGIPQSS